MANVRVKIAGNPRSNLTFEWGGVRKGGEAEFTLTDRQFEVLKAKDNSQNPVEPLFTFVVLGEESTVKAPVAPSTPKKAFDAMTPDEVKDFYRQKIGDPGKKKLKKLIQELRDGGHG